MGLFSIKPRGELQPFELSRGNVRAKLHPRVGPELSSAWLLDPSGLTPKSEGSRRWRGPSPAGGWFVKRRTGRRGRRALERSFAFGLELEEAGLAVPVHLGLLFAGDMTWLVMEFLEGRDLDEALIKASANSRSGILANLAQLIAGLHASGFRQRDLKAPNLHVSQEDTVSLLDLEGVRRGATRSRREKDLGRLAASFLALEERTCALDAPLTESHWIDFVGSYAANLFKLSGHTEDVAKLNTRARARGVAKREKHRRKGLPSR